MRFVWGIGLLVACVACAGVRDRIDAIGSGPERATVYYAAVDRLPVHATASASSRVVGELGLHEKVTRTALENGWAHVAAGDGRPTGWVDNAKLAWQAPGATTAGSPAPREPAEATPSAPAPLSDASAPAAPQSAPTEPSEAEPGPPAPAPPPGPAPPSEPARPRPATFDPF